MCGIYYYGNFLKDMKKKDIAQRLINGLKRLEYRGYDSSGLCMSNDEGNDLAIFKCTGKVNNLEQKVMKQTQIDFEKSVINHVGIAHTRWATHGEPSEMNCHPIRSDDENKFVVVHNGIISNHKELRAFLISRGIEFVTQTDTECAAKLALYFYTHLLKNGRKPEFIDVIKRVIKNCRGAYAFIFVSSFFPNEAVAVRKSSPLLVGVKTDMKTSFDFLKVNYGTLEDDEPCSKLSEWSDEMQFLGIKSIEKEEKILCKSKETDQPIFNLENSAIEIIIASDASAIIEHTKKVVYLEDDDIVHIKCGKVAVHRPNSEETDKGSSPIRKVEIINTEISQIMKGNYDHYMIKEIHEQTESVMNTMRGRIDFDEKRVNLSGLKSFIHKIKMSTRFIFIACGTSYHSALATRSLFEELIKIPISTEIASDFIDRKPPIFQTDCVFFISQSGETADSILAMKYCIENGALCVGITNTVGSTISRETTCGVHINAGPEIGVASTKAYTSQYITLVLIALQLGQDNMKQTERINDIIEGLRCISEQIQSTLILDPEIKEYANTRLEKDASFLILGRGYQYSTCLEGALKIKEIAYIHAEGILTGELKHGPLALIDDKVNALVIIMNDGMIAKTQNAVQQIKARNGNPFILCSKDIIDEMDDLPYIAIPKTVDCLQGILSVIPLQLLSYHLAIARGYDVDCPRNLAKSVSVE